MEDDADHSRLARLNRQLDFLAELDKLKRVLRHSVVANTSRQENSAEHSWHLALLVLVLAEHRATGEIDQLQVLKMVLLHDVVEIDAGDTFFYDVQANKTKAEREQLAANRIFGLLPSDQANNFHQLWEEFEAGMTHESRLAQALDRLQAVLQNLHTQGASWRRNQVTLAEVLQRNEKIGESFPEIWEELKARLHRAEADGYFAREKSGE